MTHAPLASFLISITCMHKQMTWSRQTARLETILKWAVNHTRARASERALTAELIFVLYLRRAANANIT